MVPSNLCDWLSFLLGNMGSLERFPQTNVSGEGKEEYERECVRIFYLNNTFTVLHWKLPAQGTRTVPVVSAHVRSLCFDAFPSSRIILLLLLLLVYYYYYKN